MGPLHLLVADLFFFFEDTAYSAGYTLGIPRGRGDRGRDQGPDMKDKMAQVQLVRSKPGTGGKVG